MGTLFISRTIFTCLRPNVRKLPLVDPAWTEVNKLTYKLSQKMGGKYSPIIA